MPKRGAKKEKSAAAEAGHPPLSACPRLYSAVESFLRDAYSLGASKPINSLIEALAGSTSLQMVFARPIQLHLLDLDSALRWALFLHAAPAHAAATGDPTPFGGKFLLKEAFSTIVKAYDVGLEDFVFDHFGANEDSEDEGCGPASAGEPAPAGEPEAAPAPAEAAADSD